MKRLSLIVCLLLWMAGLWAQSSKIPILERTVTLHTKNQSIETVLAELGRQADISFSYSPDAIGSDEMIAVKADHQTIRTVLFDMFQGSVSVKTRGKFVILQPAKQLKGNTPAVIEGYLTDTQGEKLADATVYSPVLQTAVTSDQYGYFRIEVDAADSAREVKVTKRGYEDVFLMPVSGKTTFVQLELPDKTTSPPDSLIRFYPEGLVNRKMQAAAENVDESFNRLIQVSLLPIIGTNSLLSGKTSNQISLNLIGGYVENVEVLELGAGINIVRHDAGVFQAAGFANYVGRNSQGFQGAGFSNFVGGSVSGLQSAGFGNVTWRDLSGFQGAGFANYAGGNLMGFQGAGFYNHTHGTLSGFQGAGFTNVSVKGFLGIQSAGFMNFAGGESSGFQGAGFLNSSGRNFSGIQGSGFMNLARQIKGAQLAGVLNVSKNISGLQASGLLNLASRIKGVQISTIFNRADTVSGVQISSVLNRARSVRGAMIGLINIADNCSGASIGLFNFIRNGVNQTEFYTTETFDFNIAHRAGSSALYTIWAGGLNRAATLDSVVYAFGLGLGTTVYSGRRLRCDADVLAQQLGFGTVLGNLNMLYQTDLSLSLLLSRKVAFFAGVSYNFYLVDTTLSAYATVFSQLPAYTLSETNPAGNLNLKTWVGFKAGLRLLK